MRQITIQQLLVIIVVFLLPLIDLLRARKRRQNQTENETELELEREPELEDSWREERMPGGVSVPIPEPIRVEHVPPPLPPPERVRVEHVPKPVAELLPIRSADRIRDERPSTRKSAAVPTQAPTRRAAERTRRRPTMTARGAREAMVAMAVFGPCRALDPPSGGPRSFGGSR